MKEVAVVVYVPCGNRGLLRQLYGLATSIRGVPALAERFELVVGCGAEIAHLIDPALRPITMPELAAEPAFRHRFNGRPYNYANSFAPFVDPEAMRRIRDADRVLRIDVDTFLCPRAAEVTPPDGEMFVGSGQFCSPEARRNLRRLMGRDPEVWDVGSTWFGDTAVVLDASARALKWMARLLKDEFDKEEGRWPGWFVGVSTMYAGQLAVTEAGITCHKRGDFDVDSTAAETIDRAFNIHCWHTNNFFSKFVHTGGGYRNRVADHRSKRICDYAFSAAREGDNWLAGVSGLQL